MHVVTGGWPFSRFSHTTVLLGSSHINGLMLNSGKGVVNSFMNLKKSQPSVFARALTPETTVLHVVHYPRRHESVALSFQSHSALSPHTSLSSELSEFTLYSSMSSAPRVKWRNSVPGISGHNGASELITAKGSFPSDRYWICITCQIWAVEYVQISVDSSPLTV